MISIQGYENYKVTPSGEVINSHSGRILKEDINNCGYRRVTLSKEGTTERFFVHRLVALHYIPNPTMSPQVNHKDGDKSNNNFSNLEWMTSKENHAHAFRRGLRAKGEDSSSTNLTNDLVYEVCESISKGLVRGEILSLYQDITKSTFDDIRSRKTWKHISKDFTW